MEPERIGLAFRRVVVGKRRDVDEPPAVTVLGLEHPAGQVILMPPGGYLDDRSAGREPAGAYRAPPFPDKIAVVGRVGLFPVSERVIDDQRVKRAP